MDPWISERGGGSVRRASPPCLRVGFCQRAGGPRRSAVYIRRGTDPLLGRVGSGDRRPRLTPCPAKGVASIVSEPG